MTPFQELYHTLRRKRANWANEEEVRLAWIMALSDALSIDFHAERDRRDSSYNNVVIEFKDRGLFRGKTTSPAFKEAIHDRLHRYINRAAKKDALDASDYIGIAIDGDHICFAQVVGPQIEHGPLLAFRKHLSQWSRQLARMLFAQQ